MYQKAEQTYRVRTESACGLKNLIFRANIGSNKSIAIDLGSKPVISAITCPTVTTSEMLENCCNIHILTT